MRPLLQISSADWIAPRLGGDFGAITRFAPSGYAAYARLCHPASDAEGRQVSWSQVAAVTGRRAHPSMQWHALIGSADPLNPGSDLWTGQNPDLGTLEPGALTRLCAVLATHTGTPEDCRFALWEGWGWICGGPAYAISASRDGAELPELPTLAEAVPAGLDEQQLAGPRIRHPGRDYLLFQGPLNTVDQCGRHDTVISVDTQSPNLSWPTDRAWFVATEVDLDSTIIAGSSSLIDAILAAPDLDAWPIQPDDSLAANADTINR